MTRAEAVTMWRVAGSRRMDAENRRYFPEWLCDKISRENAEDVIDGMVAFGLLKLDPDAVTDDQSTKGD